MTLTSGNSLDVVWRATSTRIKEQSGRVAELLNGNVDRLEHKALVAD